MSIQQVNRVLYHCGATLSPGEFKLLIYLADKADARGEHCYPSIARLATWAGMTRRYARLVLARLVDRGVVQRATWEGHFGFRLTLPQGRPGETPPRERRPERQPVVYVAKFAARVKIGHTTRLGVRIVTLSRQTGVVGELLAALAAEDAADAKRQERDLHTRCAGARITGEWFHDNDALRAGLAPLITAVDEGSQDHWKRITRSSLEHARSQKVLPLIPVQAESSPCFAQADPSSDPSFDPRTEQRLRRDAHTTEDEEWRGQRAWQPSDDGNYRVVLNLAHEAFDAHGTNDPTDPETTEALKVRCAQLGIAYSASLVARCLGAASVVRAFQRTRRAP